MTRFRKAVGRLFGAIPDWAFLLGVYVLALAPRLAFVLALGRSPLGVDEVEYDMIARSLVDGKGYAWYLGLATAFRPPGYPFFLAGIYLLLGKSFYYARLVQAFIAAAHPLATYAVCRPIFGRRAARLSAVFVALYVPLILYSLGLLTENIFIPLVLLALWFTLRIPEKGLLRGAAPAAILYGAAILVRPSLTFFMPLVVAWILLATRDWKRTVVSGAVMAAIVLAMVTPWSVRNYKVTGQFVYLDTLTGYNLYIGYREDADGSFDMDAATEMAYMLRDKVLRKEAESDVIMHNWGKARAMEFIRAHPYRALALVPLKIAHFWSLEHRMFIFAYSYNYIGELSPLMLTLFFIVLLSPYAFLALFAVVGAVFGRRKGPGLWLLLLLLGYYTALHAAVFGEARLHFPLVPVLAMLAAAGVFGLRRVRAGLRSREPRVRTGGVRRLAIMCVCILLLLTAWAHGIWYSWPQWKVIYSPGGNTAQLPY
ncbi:MAG TPA: glycosyltransferase family 39 protein [Candidatus Hydrogenedentes bacterium]|nr:glycosyltransferase family 39 protein [Candidatus Hydrogenedentota bacterium]HQE83027.1 glycosyltransferase family 39 protein [Candidatus Hydrogenedentota bacterium]HQH52587.1 glycosyltransferase family 39 protein [Candidatus Hydrogenedentota bacterium]HQM51270.1 glycosyltransferase family 39 protein [Candidatus Hydrogenedentota bacterium]